MRPEGGVATVQADDRLIGQETGELRRQPSRVNRRPLEPEAGVGHHGHHVVRGGGPLARPAAVIADLRSAESLREGAQALADIAHEGDVDGSVHADGQRVAIEMDEDLGSRSCPGRGLPVADDLTYAGTDGPP